jgi:hypothetical protein
MLYLDIRFILGMMNLISKISRNDRYCVYKVYYEFHASMEFSGNKMTRREFAEIYTIKVVLFNQCLRYY